MKKNKDGPLAVLICILIGAFSLFYLVTGTYNTVVLQFAHPATATVEASKIRASKSYRNPRAQSTEFLLYCKETKSRVWVPARELDSKNHHGIQVWATYQGGPIAPRRKGRNPAQTNGALYSAASGFAIFVPWALLTFFHFRGKKQETYG